MRKPTFFLFLLLCAQCFHPSIGLSQTKSSSKPSTQTSKPTSKTTKLSEESTSEMEFSWEVNGGLRFQFSKNSFSTASYPLSFSDRLVSGSLLLNTTGYLIVNKYFEIYANLDVGELLLGQHTTKDSEGKDKSNFLVELAGVQLNLSSSDKTAYEEAEKTCIEQAKKQNISTQQCITPNSLLEQRLLFSELYATFYLNADQWMKIDAGVFNKEIGRAFVMDDYVLGARFEANLYTRNPETALPLRFELAVFLPNSSFTSQGKKSPVVHLEVAYQFSDEEEVGFFFSYRRDGDNQAGPLLYPQWQDYRTAQLNNTIKKYTKKEANLSCNETYPEEELKQLLSKEQTACINKLGRLCNRIRNKEKREACIEAKTNDCPLNVIEENYDRTCYGLPNSSGNHMWAGVYGNKKFGLITLEGNMVLYFSSFKLSNPSVYVPIRRKRKGQPQQSRQKQKEEQELQNISSSFKGLGFSAEFKASFQWTKHFSTKLFFLFASGDSLEKGQSTLSSFIGISPQIRYTNIFFNGGINSYSSNRQLSISGISGRGFLAPGLIAEYSIKEKLNIEIVLTPLWSHVPPPKDVKTGYQAGKFYGFEANINASYQVFKWLSPVLEIDVFSPGSFFQTATEKQPLLFQVLFGVDFSFSG